MDTSPSHVHLPESDVTPSRTPKDIMSGFLSLPPWPCILLLERLDYFSFCLTEPRMNNLERSSFKKWGNFCIYGMHYRYVIKSDGHTFPALMSPFPETPELLPFILMGQIVPGSPWPLPEWRPVLPSTLEFCSCPWKGPHWGCSHLPILSNISLRLKTEQPPRTHWHHDKSMVANLIWVPDALQPSSDFFFF